MEAKKSNQKKIILIGTAGVGKTTLKKIFFESANPIELLCHQLEPTIGDEIEVYEKLKLVAIHDLAGQEWDRWLKDEPHIFDETNLIICMLEAKDVWERNWIMVQEVVSVKNMYCPNAICAFFFHKIDLLNQNELDRLSKQINSISIEDINNHYFLTSITAKYYDLTLKSILYLFQSFMEPEVLLQFNNLLFQIEILFIILQQGKVDMKTLYLQLKQPTYTFGKIINYLLDNDLIKKENNPEILSLTENGKQSLQSFQSINKRYYNQKQNEFYYFEKYG